jgi:L-fuculose-phosphate aldolase
MTTSDTVLLESLCEAGRRLHARNLLAGADGNLSCRMADGTIAITPSGRAKDRLVPGDMAFLGPEGRILSGAPSTERLMHLTVYARCPGARVVVHAHPPTAIAWSVARPDLRALPSDVLPELVLAAGEVPIVPYARPGTPSMGEVLEPFLPDHRLVILSRHGALSWGEDVEEACRGMERVEHVCLILKSALELGGLSTLSPVEVKALRAMRAKAGGRLL